MTCTLEVAGFVARTCVEGPFERAAVWVQGCSLRCPGCCNPEMFERAGGHTIDIASLVSSITGGDVPVEGVSLLGGEPLEQLPAVTALCREIAGAGLGVIVFTGYTHDEALARPGFDALAPWVDTWVTGRFRAHEPEVERRFIGSRNQVLVHATGRYADESLWRGPMYAEVIIRPPLDDEGRASATTVVGAPAIARRLARLVDRPPSPTKMKCNGPRR